MDLQGAIKNVQSIPAQSVSGTVNGTGVDTAGYDEAIVVFDCGTIAATGTLDVKVQDSADNSSFADLSGAVFTQCTPSNDIAMYVGRIRCDGGVRRYLRAVATQATAAAAASVSFVLAGKNFTGEPQTYVFDKQA